MQLLDLPVQHPEPSVQHPAPIPSSSRPSHPAELLRLPAPCSRAAPSSAHGASLGQPVCHCSAPESSSPSADGGNELFTCSCRGSEANSVSSFWFLLIHAPDLRPPRCPPASCQLSNQVGPIPAGQEVSGARCIHSVPWPGSRYRDMWPPAPAKAGLRFHWLSACFWAQALQIRQQNESFCQVRRVQSEKSLSKLFFFFPWFTWYFLGVLLSFQKGKNY